jgi:hypothetical protein
MGGHKNCFFPVAICEKAVFTAISKPAREGTKTRESFCDCPYIIGISQAFTGRNPVSKKIYGRSKNCFFPIPRATGTTTGRVFMTALTQ